MKILALEASTEVCSAALLLEGNIREEQCNSPRSHSKVLLPMVDNLLKQSGIALQELDLIALTHGPGSFTGIRICIGLAQGLAFGAGLPMYVMSTLELLAHQGLTYIKDEDVSATIIPALDARMNEVYWSVYRVSSGNSLEEVRPATVEPISNFSTAINNTSPSKFIGVGHGWGLLNNDSFNNDSFNNATLDASCKPQASAILTHLQQRLANGEVLSTLGAGEIIQPLYLRNEITWEKRRRIRGN